MVLEYYENGITIVLQSYYNGITLVCGKYGAMCTCFGQDLEKSCQNILSCQKFVVPLQAERFWRSGLVVIG